MMEQHIGMALLAVILIAREYQHWKHVNLLMDRFMATDFRQYKIMTREKVKPPAVKKPLSDSEAAALEDQQNGTIRDIASDLDEAVQKVHAGVGAS